MDLTHGKYLGVDYGDKRTGLAECDVSGMLASGIATISEGGMRKTAVRVAKEAESRSCKKIVIGLPKNMDGTLGERAEVVRAFAALLAEETSIPIDFYDERMTTMVAYRFLGETGTYGKRRKAAVDTLSAEIILQNYIDRERAENNKTN
ncbi:MAG: Holliday junction resolvase RuvX [Clostridia bacterium]|nr:Holliday junction resolvase RuvX [Clostridia bacterium]MBO5206666.1 Holliday junction resolvase RuvX [Clostridia bacterium]MBP3584034.1 Holliday junction resolvase RuvX [Clostridia bacterium]MBQ8583305.1 Holliday junction resolvase RuvX [Clostridia bacterium]